MGGRRAARYLADRWTGSGWHNDPGAAPRKQVQSNHASLRKGLQTGHLLLAVQSETQGDNIADPKFV